MESVGVPVLRWVFVRGAERLEQELSLDSRQFVYELRTRSVGRTEIVEHFRDVSGAFRGQSAFERSLVEDGWSLDHYEKLHRASGGD
jgi:hypothetical protein